MPSRRSSACRCVFGRPLAHTRPPSCCQSQCSGPVLWMHHCRRCHQWRQHRICLQEYQPPTQRTQTPASGQGYYGPRHAAFGAVPSTHLSCSLTATRSTGWPAECDERGRGNVPNDDLNVRRSPDECLWVVPPSYLPVVGLLVPRWLATTFAHTYMTCMCRP